MDISKASYEHSHDQHRHHHQQPNNSLANFASDLLKSMEEDDVTNNFRVNPCHAGPIDQHYDDFKYRNYKENAPDLISYDNYDNYYASQSNDVAKSSFERYSSAFDFKSDFYDMREDHFDQCDFERNLRAYSIDEPASTSSGSLTPNSVDFEFSMTPYQLAQQKKARKPPEGYLCHLCFCKGHYIKDCPQVFSIFT